MQIVLRNIAAFIAGAIIGSVVNMGLILIGSNLVPPPPGADMSDMEKLRASMHLFEPRHYLFPFLGHAGGAFAGGLVAYVIAGSRRMAFAISVSALFLVGGIINAIILPAPVWFLALDLLVAYLPMGWAAGSLGRKLQKRTA